MIKFAIYGQYFGGNWPNHTGKVKAVQKGIYYTPDHQFMAFDIKIFTEETAFWVDVIDIPKLLKDNMKSVPVYAKGPSMKSTTFKSKLTPRSQNCWV